MISKDHMFYYYFRHGQGVGDGGGGVQLFENHA